MIRLFRAFTTFLFGLLILFEEWGWQPLQRAAAWVMALPILRSVERWIGSLPPYAALVTLALPSILLFPIKLGALWLIGHDHVLAGMASIVAAKIGGTALLARLFAVTQPALMQLTWFAVIYNRWHAWKVELLARVRASWPWRAGRVMKRKVQRLWKQWRQAWITTFSG